MSYFNVSLEGGAKNNENRDLIILINTINQFVIKISFGNVIKIERGASNMCRFLHNFI